MTITYCCYGAYCEAGHSPECGTLKADNMNPPTPTIDVERLAREAGIDDSAPLTPYMLQRLSVFRALVLEDAAMRVEAASYRSRWARACSNSKRVADPCEYAAIVRALAAGVR